MESRTVRVGAWIRSTEAASVAGIVYGLLAFVAVSLLFRYPDLALSDPDLTAWFDDAGNRGGLILGLNLTAISSIAFL